MKRRLANPKREALGEHGGCIARLFCIAAGYSFGYPAGCFFGYPAGYPRATLFGYPRAALLATPGVLAALLATFWLSTLAVGFAEGNLSMARQDISISGAGTLP